MTDVADREVVAYRWRRPGWDYVVTKEHPENRYPRVTDYTDLEPLYADSDEGATVTAPHRDPTRTEDVEEREGPTNAEGQPLPYPPQNGRTHWEECWRTPKHHNCAVEKVYHQQEKIRAARRRADRLEEELEKMTDPPLVLRDDDARDVASWFVERARRALDSREGEGVPPRVSTSGSLGGTLPDVADTPPDEEERDEWKERQCGACGAASGEPCWDNCPAKGCDCPVHADEPEGDDGEHIPLSECPALSFGVKEHESPVGCRHYTAHVALVGGPTYTGGGETKHRARQHAVMRAIAGERRRLTDEPVSREGDRGGSLDQVAALLRVDRRDLNHGHTVGKYACRKCGPLGGEMSALDCLDAEHIVYGPFRTEPIAEKVMGLIDYQLRDRSATHADARSDDDGERPYEHLSDDAVGQGIQHQYNEGDAIGSVTELALEAARRLREDEEDESDG